MIDIYSKRQKRLRGEIPDVYRYDDLPRPLRVQIVHIWRKAFKAGDINLREHQFQRIREVLCEEYGVFDLSEKQGHPSQKLEAFFLSQEDLEKCLDVIELVFARIDKPRVGIPQFKVAQARDVAIGELNGRFREHGVGYQYVSGQIVRVDSELIHSEVVRPALEFLQQAYLSGANQEFLSAHEHYRRARYMECLNDCLKSFESTMKAICVKRNWAYSANATAKPLIAVCRDNRLFPVFMDNHLNGLVMCLESGVPTARNKTSGHGQGTTPTQVEPEFAAYVLHLTAANILFLATAEKRLK